MLYTDGLEALWVFDLARKLLVGLPLRVTWNDADARAAWDSWAGEPKEQAAELLRYYRGVLNRERSSDPQQSANLLQELGQPEIYLSTGIALLATADHGMELRADLVHGTLIMTRPTTPIHPQTPEAAALALMTGYLGEGPEVSSGPRLHIDPRRVGRTITVQALGLELAVRVIADYHPDWDGWSLDQEAAYITDGIDKAAARLAELNERRCARRRAVPVH